MVVNRQENLFCFVRSLVCLFVFLFVSHSIYFFTFIWFYFWDFTRNHPTDFPSHCDKFIDKNGSTNVTKDTLRSTR